jgi:RND family efflux transporter MFP subunit
MELPMRLPAILLTCLACNLWAVEAPLAVAPAEQRAHRSLEMLPGSVRADQSATLMARVQGVVAAIRATPGSMVAAGDVLVELDALELSAMRDQAKAQAAQAAADFARVQRLFDGQTASKAEFDAAQARAAASAAAAAQAEVMVGYTRIRAPFAGVVVRRHAEVGDLLSPGRPVIDLEDQTTLRLNVEVPESLSALVTVGAALRVQIPAAGFDAETQVVEVTPAADPISRTVLAKLTLPKGLAALRSGQFGRVGVPLAQGELLSVPASAVVRRGQLDAVFVVAEGVARLRLVRLGGVSDGQVAIRAGLSAGELVALEPANLRDGQPVGAR